MHSHSAHRCFGHRLLVILGLPFLVGLKHLGICWDILASGDHIRGQMVQTVEANHFGGAALLEADSGNSSVVVPVVDMVPGELVKQRLKQNVDESAVADNSDPVLGAGHGYQVCSHLDGPSAGGRWVFTVPIPPAFFGNSGR